MNTTHTTNTNTKTNEDDDENFLLSNYSEKINQKNKVGQATVTNTPTVKPPDSHLFLEQNHSSASGLSNKIKHASNDSLQ